MKEEWKEKEEWIELIHAYVPFFIINSIHFLFHTIFRLIKQKNQF